MGMTRFQTSVVLAAVVLAGASLSAQAPAPQPGQVSRPTPTPQAPSQAQPVVVFQDSQTAREVQQQLRELMYRFPPSLHQVIQADPSLLSRPDYIAAYPPLVAFLQQHPDVARNPSFYFGEAAYEQPQSDRARSLGVIRNTIEGIGFLTGFLTVISLVYSLLRQALEYRRWKKQLQIQTELHTKLFDRMTNNQELLAYIESGAGRRFLEGAAPTPTIVPATAPTTIAPVMRILWSVQIGVVVVAAGIGFWIARATVDDVDLSSVFQVMGSLAIAVGIGFIASALLSWALSLRMGLMTAPEAKAE